MKQNYKSTFTMKLTQEELIVLQRLKKDYGINLSATAKILFKQKLEHLDKTQKHKK